MGNCYRRQSKITYFTTLFKCGFFVCKKSTIFKKLKRKHTSKNYELSKLNGIIKNFKNIVIVKDYILRRKKYFESRKHQKEYF